MFLNGWKMLVLWWWKGHVICRALIVACLKSREAYTCLYLLVSNFSQTKAVKLHNLIFRFCIFEKQIFTIRVQLHCLKKRKHYSIGQFLAQGSMNLQFGIDATWVFLYSLKLHKGVAGQFFSAGVIELTHFSPTVFLTARKTDPLKIPP